MTQLETNSVWQGTLSLMVLRTRLTMGEQHGYGIARRIEQTSEGKLSGRKQIERDTRQWAETSAIMTRFLAASED